MEMSYHEYSDQIIVMIMVISIITVLKCVKHVQKVDTNTEIISSFLLKNHK